ncbi:MAG: hypothetical protein AB7S39_16850 [Gemmatimonadales bacterium]
MRRSLVGLVAVAAVGCGKAKDTSDAVGAAVQAAANAPKVETAMAAAEAMRNERIARGDTVAIPYAELKTYLPESIDGYTPEGEAEGSQQSMPGFSLSQAERTWEKTGVTEGDVPSVHVTIADFGGTEQAYGMIAAPLFMGFTQEDDHHRAGATPTSVADAAAWEEYDKDTRDAKITLVARYRYLISVEARNQTEDQSAMVKRVAEEVARKFDGK